ncbi:hypothetical protein J3R30DRAFT_3499922 [Lentinula aciculospora]|uniref:Uncharacterized protein n=1 Tax=Lentinula aciculospora TaxID=153920 RepID=A0A9W9A8T2_9AGAR|nr:hypothetical protein J3R30DRAFT_3499922 [Lentinula aciculospora]
MHGATPLVVAIVSSITAHAHIAAYNKGMWCINGSTGADVNSNDPVIPMYKLEFDQWWMHAFNGCDKRPPNEGDFLTLPAGDSVVLELSSNQAFSSLSYGGKLASDWPNGHDYSDDLNDSTCITAPNLHAQNQSMAAGTALAISYESDVSKMTPENLVVISVAYNTPFKRLTTYDIPSGLPSCPEGGCICGWGWIPNGCGTPNMYLSFSRCQVENSGNKTLGTPQAPVWCEGESSACVEGPKQMLYWNQASGNNIAVEGDDSSGKAKSPGYNSKCGFADGAQNDIFNESSTSESMLTKKSTLQETGEGLYDLYARTSDRDGGESTTVERSILRWARSNLGY